MTANERFRRFKEWTGWSRTKCAEIFGVTEMTISCWCSGRQSPARDCLQTLLRLELELKNRKAA